MPLTRVPFELRGIPGVVTVDYRIDEDPHAWGYPALCLPHDIEFAHGFPVLRAWINHSAEGYGAVLGWIQIVRHRRANEESSFVDMPPQLAQAGIPWSYWGIRPAFFDAPSTREREFRFRADTFLAVTPDAVTSPEVQPLCGFSWGYDVHDGRTSIVPLTTEGLKHWPDACPILERHCPDWTFRNI
jgi:hypothetical protein